ncbi:MAG: sensor histidine kinase [Rhodobacteraceae bacterium]|nr:sensor histidine kinase [Paracoccaceae bacterium]
MFNKRRAIWVFAFAIFVATLTGGVWSLAYRTALDQLAQRGQGELALASDRLTGHLFRYRELAVVLSEHPELVTLLTRPSDNEQANSLLRRVADKTGARALELVDTSGRIVATSLPEIPSYNTSAEPLRRALNGALGRANRVEATRSGPARRLFSFAAPVFAGDGPSQGAIVAEVDIWLFEQNWPTSEAVVFFVNENEDIIVSNRSELVLSGRSDVTFLGHTRRLTASHDIWSIKAGPYLPMEAMHLVRDLPVIGLVAEILLDTAPARQRAALQAQVAAALCLVFGALLFLAAERRRALAASLAQEEAANTLLEARVAKRTEALSDANADLRREVGERRDAEAALKQAQADLVQAGKLSALGQMSAGISHELNQPLMAIRSFAENGAVFLERGKREQAAGNLARISDMARRMGRIIKNLRAFSRNENEPMTRVNLVQVIDNAVELIQPRLRADDIALEWTRPSEPVYALGGEVRLAQVFVNLINNSADAMTGQTGTKSIQIFIDNGHKLAVTVRDTGPGIADPEKVFEPFYTTKEVGSSEGMGLGLSISYGLVQSFGGNIRSVNATEGGAMFTVELEYWAAERAA